jgi:hypothetical protein
MNTLFAFTQAAIGSIPKSVLAGVVVSAALGASIQPANALGSLTGAGSVTNSFVAGVDPTSPGSTFTVNFGSFTPTIADGVFAGTTGSTPTIGSFEVLSGSSAKLTSTLNFALDSGKTVSFAENTLFNYFKSGSTFFSATSTTSGTVLGEAESFAFMSYQDFGVPGTRTYSMTAAVPGPLPILGAAAAFGYSRKLRNRINQSKQQTNLS